MMREVNDNNKKKRHYVSSQKFTALSDKIRWDDLQENIHRLLNSDRNKHIKKVFNGKAFCVDKSGKSILYTGLNERLKKILWPETEGNPMKRSYEDVKRRATTKKYSVKHKTVAKDCKQFGHKHGSTVHREMEIYGDFCRFNKGMNWLNTNMPDPDPCTTRFISTINSKGWIPIASEFMIYDEEWRVATSIDMIVYDPVEKDIIILEFKTGFENEEYGPHPSDPKLPVPFDGISNCPLMRHQFQLLGMIRILQRNYGMHGVRSYILRACPKSKQTETIGPCNWCGDRDYIKNLDECMID